MLCFNFNFNFILYIIRIKIYIFYFLLIYNFIKKIYKTKKNCLSNYFMTQSLVPPKGA